MLLSNSPAHSDASRVMELIFPEEICRPKTEENLLRSRSAGNLNLFLIQLVILIGPNGQMQLLLYHVVLNIVLRDGKPFVILELLD